MQVKTQQDGFSRSAQLLKLLDKAVPTFRKYAPSDDKEGLPVKTYCEAIAKVPNLGHYKTQFVAELLKIFKKQGFKQKQIQELLDFEIQQAEREKSDKERDEQAERMKELFGIAYTPTTAEKLLPERWKAALLRYSALQYVRHKKIHCDGRSGETRHLSPEIRQRPKRD